MNTRVLRAEHLGSVRMYPSFGDIWHAFEKNSYRLLTVNPRGGIHVVIASIMLTSYAPILAWLGLAGQWPAAAFFALLPGCLLFPWYRTPAALLYAPFAIYLFQPIALCAILFALLGRKTIWKGRLV
jgi:hypothetical protein